MKQFPRGGNSVPQLSTDRCGRDGGVVNKLGLRAIFCITILSFNLLTGAESPVSEKEERINNIEYNGTLKYERYFLRKPPLTTKPYPLTPNMYSKAAMEYATREQAKSELSRQNQFKSLTVVGFLDKSLFNDGLTTILAKGLRGVATTLGDITNGLGLLSDKQLDDLYKQSRDWTSSVTLSDLKARTQTGIVNLHDAQKAQVREMMFTELGKILSPSLGGMDPTQIGQLLKYQMDQKQAKEDARDQKLKDAGTVVSVAAAAALTVATAGGGAPIMTSIVAGTATTAQYVAAVAITATNAGVQAYVAGETGGGNNGAIAGVANAAISTITAGAGSAFTGYVSWTPHRAGNLFTGEDAVSGGWGGGLSGSFQGTSGLLKGVGLNGGLSFQPGSGVGVNMNVNLPGSTGLPRGSFLGINYQTGSGAYTASGGFSLYQNGNSSTGISLSASNSGYANVGLNYNKDGNSFLNRLQGYSLNIGSDGLLSLHNQFRGADVLSLGYNFNTHTFDPIGINQNFQNDYNNSVTQENAAANAAASAEKLAEKRQEWLDAQRTKPGYEGLSDQAVFDKYKSENSGAGGSRLDLPSQVFGSLGDMFGGSLGLFNSSGEGYLNSQGEFVPRTCFTAGTLVHTSQGTKKIEEIQVGDEVLSWDEESGEVSYKAVTELFVHDINHLFDVEVNFQETFHTTWNHPFWLVNERSWVQVKDLKVGDIVQLKDGSSVPITKISAYSVSKTSVYNLEIEENHSYYVGKGGVLVHNYAIPLGARILHALVTAGIAYCSSNNCGGVINSNGNPNENKPELPAIPRDPSLTQNEAEQMHRQGLNPMNSNDIQRYKYAFSKANATISNATTEWKDLGNLLDHVERHGSDFGITSPFEYAQKATDFLKNAKANGYQVRVDPKGITRVYDPQTNTFGSYNPDGSTKTFYKPAPKSASNLRGYDPTEYSSPLDYWNRAPINQGVKPW
ncbi:TIGR04388 family protein (plasmid) [Leptospira weilii]|uniref:TIGR04388 family protein n=1 Tax=Leptospira weilii TaxID=28184 RepID=UPI00201B7B16|nr:TIGR04388 family protein [Leptospira weilii]UPY81078.1 TIGR04388 family protein [Leptospira weilii]